MRILKNFISIDDLETRWRLDKKQIESLSRARGNAPYLMMWYASETRVRTDGGVSAFVSPARYLNGCILNMADVLKIEELYPELVPQNLKQENISDETLRNIAPAECESDRIVELEAQLAEAQALIADLQAQLAAAEAEPPTTVNASMWENSVKAAFGVWAAIVMGDKADWIEGEFKLKLKERYSNYHTKVLALAWSALPDDFKNGRGRPKTKP